MNEDILQFIWLHRLLKPGDIKTVNGSAVKVISPGTLNRDSGPDFFNAQLNIGGLLLSGNVEIHVRSSDWKKHGHERDRAYDSILLHVVLEHDEPIEQNLIHRVEVLEVRTLIDPAVLSRYETFHTAGISIPCQKQLQHVPDIVFTGWAERLAIERLEQRVTRIDQLVRQNHGDYAQALYTLLLSAFGFGINSAAFEMLGRALPLRILIRHSDNLQQTEALLFGTAGMIDEQLEAAALRNLQNEFAFLRRKYGLHPIKKEVFKFSRMRPSNFPALRIAQFAAFFHRSPWLLTAPLALRTREELVDHLRANLSAYWQRHYNTGNALSAGELHLGKQAAELLVVNVFAPFYFYCGRRFSHPEQTENALGLLRSCAAELNRKTRLFAKKKHLVRDAFGSQGLIQLADQYCQKKQCLRCAIGTALLSAPAQPAPVLVG